MHDDRGGEKQAENRRNAHYHELHRGWMRNTPQKTTMKLRGMGWEGGWVGGGGAFRHKVSLNVLKSNYLYRTRQGTLVHSRSKLAELLWTGPGLQNGTKKKRGGGRRRVTIHQPFFQNARMQRKSHPYFYSCVLSVYSLKQNKAQNFRMVQACWLTIGFFIFDQDNKIKYTQ